MKALKCPNCGARLPSPDTDNIQCEYCGTVSRLSDSKTKYVILTPNEFGYKEPKLTPERAAEIEQIKAKRKRNKLIMTMLLIAGSIIGGAVGLLFLGKAIDALMSSLFHH